METELKRCPFCGSRVEIIPVPIHMSFPNFHIMCTECSDYPLMQCDSLYQIRVNWNARCINGNTSDGYHTFNELYHHRAILFAVVCGLYLDKTWKSKQHSDGTMFTNMFIVGIETPKGQATYHYDIDPYWDIFSKIKEVERAPIWDGHTAQEAIERISSFIGDTKEI